MIPKDRFSQGWLAQALAVAAAAYGARFLLDSILWSFTDYMPVTALVGLLVCPGVPIVCGAGFLVVRLVQLLARRALLAASLVVCVLVLALWLPLPNDEHLFFVWHHADYARLVEQVRSGTVAPYDYPSPVPPELETLSGCCIGVDSGAGTFAVEFAPEGIHRRAGLLMTRLLVYIDDPAALSSTAACGHGHVDVQLQSQWYICETPTRTTYGACTTAQ